MVEGHVAKAVGVQVPLSALNENTRMAFYRCRVFCFVPLARKGKLYDCMVEAKNILLYD